MSGLRECVALVTGAGGGIGTAICAALEEAGATVIATDLAADRRPGAHWFDLDVTSAEDWGQAMAEVRSRHGRLDILVNNAAIARIAKFEDVTIDEWRKTQAVNVEGLILGVQAALPLLRENGGRRRGGASIVNVSSVAGLVGAAFSSVYCATKGAGRMLTKALAAEFIALKYDIRVNSVHPGAVDTSMRTASIQSYTDMGFDMTAALEEYGRVAEPAEIAAGVRFLASDDSSYMNGAELVLDNAFTAR